MIQFGLFLVDRGWINAEQLVQAQRHQLDHRVPIGQIAVKNRMLTVKQVFKVLGEQVETYDLFGETAVRLGFLTEQQLGKLILEQAASYPALSDVLVEQELLTAQVVLEELDAYRRLMLKRTDLQSDESLNQRAFETVGIDS